MAYIKIPIEIPELEALMSEIQDTKAKVEALSGQIDEMQTRVTEDVQALKDKLAAADIDQAVLTEINQGLDSISARVSAIDPDPSNPAPEAP